MNVKRLRELINNLRYKDWRFLAGVKGADMYLQVEFIARDTVTGHAMMQKGRKWLISTHATESEVVFTALKAVLTAEEHETRENFKYYGRAIANPHIDVRTLWRVAHETDGRK